ncbi:type I 3-dehydroquinate dehydratase [Candidatus Bathyarchaeota archaeon]|nr:type I 3-dehydroquinate dehydratase [Candidatus Bathyarchaeota archaeon]MBS7631327.1 type I 3-dehydroquinate dehydratase [Candidatus Bathyarchaeota archaeon]
MKPRICLSIAVGDVQEASQLIEENEIWEPDMVEIRLDHLRTVTNLGKIRECTGLPLIATFRLENSKDSYWRLDGKNIPGILEACNAMFDYVDLDLSTPRIRTLIEELRRVGVKVIISHHDFDGTPSTSSFRKILDEELSLKPEVCKIVGTAKNYADNLAYLNFISEAKGVRLVCFGMGREGKPSRIFSPLLGGAFTYASPHGGPKSAPGQLSIADLRKIYALMEATG